MVDAHTIRQDLLAYLTILEKLVAKLLISACEICVNKKGYSKKPNQSNLSVVLENNRKILKKSFVANNDGTKRLLMDNSGNPLPAPNIEAFDITLLTALVKNIPENSCFDYEKRTRCNSTCVTCDVKEAAEDVRNLRNTVIHSENGVDIYEELSAGRIGIPNFQNHITWESLKNHIEGTVFKRLHDYIKSNANFPETGKDEGEMMKHEKDIKKIKLEMKIMDNFLPEERRRTFDRKVIEMIIRENKKQTDEWKEKLDDAEKNITNLLSDILRTLAKEQELDKGKIITTPIYKIGDESSESEIDFNSWKNECLKLYEQFFKIGVNCFDFIEPKDDLERVLNDWFNKVVKQYSPYDYAIISNYSAKDHQLFERGEKAENLTSTGFMLLLSFKPGNICFLKPLSTTSLQNINAEKEALKEEVKTFKKLFPSTKVKPFLIHTNELEMENESIFKQLKDVNDVMNWIREFGIEEKDLDRNNCDKMLSRILGYLSILHKKFPHIDDNPFQLINKIPLTKKQNDIVESDVRHVILRGSYGTGKTLVLRKKIRKLVSVSKEPITVYYILNDSVGMLYEETKEFLEDYKKELDEDGRVAVTFVLTSIGSINYPHRDLDALLKLYIKEENNTHVFIDEFNAETLTPEVGTKIKSLLETKMKQSCVFLIPQPLQAERIMNKQINERKGFCFEKTGMENCFLDENIRNPESIHELLDASREILSEFSSEYRFERKLFYDDFEMNPDDIRKRDVNFEMKDEIEEEEDSATDNENSFTKSSFQKASSKINLPSAVEISFQKTSRLSSDEYSEKLENNYRIDGEPSCGNAIKVNHLPSCFFLETNVPFQSIRDISKDQLFSAFTKALATHVGSIIVCSTFNESILCEETLTSKLSKEMKDKMEIYLPAFKEQDKLLNISEVYEKRKDRIIITDFLGIRGTELSNVIVFLSTDAYFTAAFFPEILTRSSYRLSFIYLDISCTDSKNSLALRLKDKWVKEKLIEQVTIPCTNSKDHDKLTNVEDQNDEVLSMDERLHLKEVLRIHVPRDQNDEVMDERLRLKELLSDTTRIGNPTQRWARLAIGINTHVKAALIDILHNRIDDPQVQALPSDPHDLYKFLQMNRRKIQNATHLKRDQKSILLPTSSQTVDSSLLDIHLITFLIRIFCGIRNAKGDWSEPDSSDPTLCAWIYRAGQMRNFIFQDNNIAEIDEEKFEQKWTTLQHILFGLKYQCDIEPIRTSGTLDIERTLPN